MVAKQGKSETDNLLCKLIPKDVIFDVSGLTGGEGFMSNVWKFGYAPDLCKSETLPNAAAIVRVVIQGEVQLITCPTTGLAAAIGADNMTELSMKLQKLTSDGLNEMQKTVPVYSTTVQHDDAVYIPMGWWVCENVVSGTLCYGVRKSFITGTEKAKLNYTANIDLLRKSGRDVSRFEEVLAMLA